MMIVKKVAGLALAAVLPGLGLLGTPTAVVAATSSNLLPAMDSILPQSVISHSQKIGPVNPSSPFSFGVVLPSKNPQGLKAMANAVSTPGSPFYHHFLTHAQVFAQYGPNMTMASALQAKFASAGLKTSMVNQMLMVKGTVAQVNALFKTELTRYHKGSTSFVAAKGPLAIPSWLRGAAGLTGFAQGTPATGFLKAKHMSLKWAPRSTMGQTPQGATSSAQNGPFAVTVERVTGGPRSPGLAVRYLVTATVGGYADTSPLYVAGLTGPYAGASSLVQWYSNPGAGQILMDFTVSQQQDISLALTVSDGYYSATVQLPSASFIGPDAVTTNASQIDNIYGTSGTVIAPWNPASNNLNTVFHAHQLVNAATQYGEYYRSRPTIGVYTAGGMYSPSSYYGISFSVPENDANLFAGQFNRQRQTFSTGYVGPNSFVDYGYGGIEGEMSLDLQMMETSAPGSHVVVYSAGSLRSALNQVGYQDRVQVFSISYGGGELIEQAFAPGAQASWDMLAQMANLEGITISVSAGDNGAYSGALYQGFVPTSMANAPQPSYPANSAYVSAIGGTEVAVNTQGGISQAAMWGGNVGGEIPHPTLLQFLSQQNMIASGGISTIEATPGYQSMLNYRLSGRMTPDFSLPASVVTPGFYTYFDGSPGLSGGTSASAPLFAGWMADLATTSGRFGNVNPVIYSMVRQPSFRLPGGAIMTPVTFGNNGYYSNAGKDNAVTGLGQLNVDALYRNVMYQFR